MNQQNVLFETPKLALNRVEAAKALSVSPATLDRLANRGLIFPCRATGRPLLWKRLREASASHGFGRIELLPLKYSGTACARYFTKYLTKAFGSEKMFGEEKCRLFGVWGGLRFVHSRFTFLSSRIIQKRKQWFAEQLGYSDPSELKKLSKHWWFHFGKALCEVIMPQDFYKVGPPNDRHLDELGLHVLARDWAAWPGEPSDDLMMRSQFNLFYEIGIHLFGRTSGQALQYALYLMAESKPHEPASLPADRQVPLGFRVPER